MLRTGPVGVLDGQARNMNLGHESVIGTSDPEPTISWDKLSPATGVRRAVSVSLLTQARPPLLLTQARPPSC